MNLLKTFKNHLAQASLEYQLLMLFVSGLTVLALVASMATAITTVRMVKDEFVQRNQTVAKAFAKQSALALLYGSQENAKEAAQMIKAFQNVKYAAIYELNERLLFQYGEPVKEAETKLPFPSQLEKGAYWIFAEPVVISGEENEETEMFRSNPKTLGYIKLLVDKSELWAIQKSIIFSNILIIFLLSAGLFILLRRQLKRVTHPLHSLAETMQKREEGEMAVRVSLQGFEELTLIGKAFNNMMGALEEREAKLISEMQGRRQAEEKVRQHQLQLAHFFRLKTMGEMASGIAHELNQPLAAIVNYAGGCLERLQNEPISPQIVEALQRINMQAERAGAIIHRLKDFLKKGDVTAGSIDVNEVIRGILKLIELELRQDQIQVNLQLSEVPFACIDKTHFEQVVMNIAQNAMEAMRNNSESQLKVLTFTTLHSKGEPIEVRINDTGPGIPAEILDKLFDPFFTTKTQGMGMGLSIVSSIIESHGGRIQVHSDLGKGAEFRIFLPIEEMNHT